MCIHLLQKKSLPIYSRHPGEGQRPGQRSGGNFRGQPGEPGAAVLGQDQQLRVEQLGRPRRAVAVRARGLQHGRRRRAFPAQLPALVAPEDRHRAPRLAWGRAQSLEQTQERPVATHPHGPAPLDRDAGGVPVVVGRQLQVGLLRPGQERAVGQRERGRRPRPAAGARDRLGLWPPAGNGSSHHLLLRRQLHDGHVPSQVPQEARPLHEGGGTHVVRGERRRGTEAPRARGSTSRALEEQIRVRYCFIVSAVFLVNVIIG